jgi:rhodanese-related sulfurtransferase
MTTSPDSGRFRRIDPDELERRLAGPRPPLLLDVRRGAAFEGQPGIPTALRFALDREPLRLPDLPRERPIAAYCL